jgi:oligoendopeptidase F
MQENQPVAEDLRYHLIRDRSLVPERYKWRLQDIYPSDADWREAKAKLFSALPAIGQYHGILSSSPGKLCDCLDLVSSLSKEYVRLYCYASMSSDLDTRNALYTGMEQEMSQIGSELSAASSFIQPEIIASFNVDMIKDFLREEPRLEVYRHELDDLMRRKRHTRTEGEEQILAESGLMADGPQSVYSIFSDADFPFPQLVLSDGSAIRLDKPAFALQRASTDRTNRKNAFETFFGRMNEFRRTFGAQLLAQVRKDVFYMKARRYGSCLERALDDGNIPVDVYHSLIENVNRHLPTFHRYLGLRQRMLGLDRLHYHDLYCPVVREIDLEYTIEESTEHILASLAPLGKEYGEVAAKGLADRWVDVFPNEGKRSGAYSNGGVYDVHPYMLLNYNGKYDDMSTLAHELGHTMHSYLSNKHQPYPTSHYSIFVAEVASTLNEALLMDHMMKNATSDEVRLSLLGNQLDAIRGTVFRQTQFSEFELLIHQKVERGEALTGDALNELYHSMNKRYYGHDAGGCVVDDVMQCEWTYIPHFYYNFYVYQYATSFTASAYLSEKILEGDQAVRDRYLELLSSGGSDYPVNLLKKAGVDLTTSEPFELTIRKMNRIMDEMEAILTKN